MDVTPFVLTPAALRAAVVATLRMGSEQDDDNLTAALVCGALNVLQVLLDPAHQVGGAAPMQGQALNPAATAPAEPVNPEAGTPAPRALSADADPPIAIPELPAGPGSAADTARPSPAAEAPAPPTVPEPAHVDSIPAPEAKHAPPGDRQPLRTQRITLTAEQEARLRDLWPDRTARGSAIREALNAMDGPRITNDGTLYSIAHRLGLGTRSALWAAQDAAASPPTEQDAAETDPTHEPPIDAPSAPAPKDEGPAEPAPPPRPKLGGSQVVPAAVASRDDVKAEAFDAFDRDLTVRDIAADFGEPIATISMWQAEWRLLRKQQQGTTE